MTLIVTDSNGRKYRPTGCFREPKPGEYVYCYDHKRVEFAGFKNDVPRDVDRWCSNGHPEFMLHRIICEPLPVTYVAHVELTQEEMDVYLHMDAPRSDEYTPVGSKRLFEAIRNGNYEERHDNA